MDRGAWQATVHGVSRVRHDLVIDLMFNSFNSDDAPSVLFLQVILVFASVGMGVCAHVLVAQSCPTFVTPWTVACQAVLSPWIFQARTLEQIAIPTFRGSSQPREWTQVSRIVGKFLTVWATREAWSLLRKEKWLSIQLVCGLLPKEDSLPFSPHSPGCL